MRYIINPKTNKEIGTRNNDGSFTAHVVDNSNKLEGLSLTEVINKASGGYDVKPSIYDEVKSEEEAIITLEDKYPIIVMPTYCYIKTMGFVYQYDFSKKTWTNTNKKASEIKDVLIITRLEALEGLSSV